MVVQNLEIHEDVRFKKFVCFFVPYKTNFL